MSNYKPMPMSVDDLENFNQLFHVSIEGIETHLTGDQLDVNYVISTLLALSRQLDFIVHDVAAEDRKVAGELMRLKMSGSGAEEMPEAV